MATFASNGSAAGKERFWRGHVEGWQRGGVTQREYCDRHGLALSTFALWRRRLLAAGSAPTAAPQVEIIPLRQVLCSVETPIVLIVGAGRYRLELRDGFQTETLRAAVAALEGY